MNVYDLYPRTAQARLRALPGSARRQALALDAFAQGELPLDDRPPGAPAGRGVRIFVIEYGGPPPTVTPVDGHVRHGRGAAATSPCGGLGQRTAITEVIRCIAPAAEVFAARILGQGASTTADVLEGALEFALRSGARIVSLRMPFAQGGGAGHVATVCRRAAQDGVILVGSATDAAVRGGDAAVPAEVIGAIADARLAARSMRYVPGARFECRAAGSPLRSGPPHLRDPSSHSFAAARVSATVACILEARPRADLGAVRAELESHFAGGPHRRKEHHS